MAAHRNSKFDQAYGRYLVGESMASIARSMGVHRNVVRQAFARRGFKKTNRWLTTKEQRDMICFLFKTGNTQGQPWLKCMDIKVMSLYLTSWKKTDIYNKDYNEKIN